MKKRLILFAIVVCSLVGIHGQVNEGNSQGFLTRGILMYNARNYAGCIDQLTHAKSLLLTPSQREEADYYCAMASLAEGCDEAKALLSEFLSNYGASSRIPNVLMALGDYEFLRKNYGAALLEYQKVVPEQLNDARNEEYRYRVAYCYLLLAEYDAADAGFKSLNNSQRYSNAARFYEGYIAYCKRDFDTAFNVLNSVDTSTAPANMADYYLSQIYFMRGDYDKALSLSKKLLSQEDIDVSFVAESNRIAGESLYNLGNETEALSYLKRYIDIAENPLPSALYILGVSEYNVGEYSQAIKHLTPATECDNAMGQSAYLFIGQSYVKEKDYDAALLAFEKASRMDFDDKVQETAFYNYAITSQKGGRVPFGNSVAIFEEFLLKFPQSQYAPEVQEYVVAGYMAEKNYEKAHESIKGIKQPNDNILKAKQQVLYALGQKNFSNDKIAQAIKYFSEAKKLSAQDKEIARECDLWLGDCYYRQGKYSQASASYLSYLKQAPATAENISVAYYSLGYSRFAEKRYDDAIVNFERVIKKSVGLDKTIVADAYNRIGDCYYYNGKFEQANSYYSKSYEANPASGDYALYQNALMKGHARDYEGKIKDLDKLLKSFPSSKLAPAALLEKAEAYLALGDNEKAIKTYQQLTSKHQSTPQGRNGLLQMAITYMSMGEKDNAIQSYKKVVADFPTSEEAKVASDDLKRIYADDGNLSEYAQFLKSISGAPSMDATEMDVLTFQAAEKAYLTNNDTAKMIGYIEQYPEGLHRSQALYYLCANEMLTKNDVGALKYATEIVEKYPKAEVYEDALVVKADVEHRQGKGEMALVSYKNLAQRATNERNQMFAQMGIMVISREMGNHEDVVACADKLLSIASIDNDIKREVEFVRAYSLKELNRNSEAEKAWGELAQDVSDIHGAKSAYYLGQYYYDNNKLGAARKTIEAFIEANTPHQYWLARGFILLSDINRREGKTFEADEYLKTIKENYPGTEADIFRMIDERLK